MKQTTLQELADESQRLGLYDMPQTTPKRMKDHIKGRLHMSLEDVREGLVSKLYFGEYPIDNILLNALHYLGVNADD